MKFRLAISICLALAAPLPGQTPPPLSQEIVVTGSAMPDSMESTPSAVTIITKEEIEARGARDVADLLREVPGLMVSRSGSSGKATSLFSRGGNSTHTLVLWNGIEINNPYFAGYDWGRFSTAGVERVEVVRGPFSALYGSEAVSGVVNILTTPRNGGLDFDLQAGERGLLSAVINERFIGSAISGQLSADTRQDDGSFQNDDFRQTSANASLRWSGIKRLSLGMQVRATDYDLGIPFNNDASGAALIPSLLRRQRGQELQFAVPLSGAAGRILYDFTVSESRRDDDFDDREDPFGFTRSSTNSVTRRAHLLGRARTQYGTVSAGAELERAEVDDRSNFGVALDQSTRTNRAFFLEDRISRPLTSTSRLEISVGARYDAFDEFGSETSPRLAAALITTRGKWRVAYGEGFRAPSIGELYFPFSGNPDLRAERSRSAELGFDLPFTNSLFSVTLFNSFFRQLIVFDNAQFRFSNIGRARSSGGELAAEKRVASWARTGITYTRLNTREQETGRPLLRRPRHSGTAFLIATRRALAATVVVQYIGARPDLLPTAPFTAIDAPAYATADITLRYDLGKASPYVKVENAGDTFYEEVTGYRSPGRRVIVGARFEVF